MALTPAGASSEPNGRVWDDLMLIMKLIRQPSGRYLLHFRRSATIRPLQVTDFQVSIRYKYDLCPRPSIILNVIP